VTDYVSVAVGCETDPISLATMATFAQQTDSGLATVSTLATTVLNRPFVSAQANGPSGVANAVVATLTWNTPSARLNPFGMFNPASPTLFTLPENGSYLVSLIATLDIATTVTSSRAALLLAGVEFAWARWPGTTNVSSSFEISGLILGGTAGQQVTATRVFTGTGNTNYSGDQIYIVKISDGS
jgi:hypothetical protein